jgi:hypothetical protein
VLFNKVYLVDTSLISLLKDEKYIHEILENEIMYNNFFCYIDHGAIDFIKLMEVLVENQSQIEFGDYVYNISSRESKNIALRNLFLME